VVSSLSCHAICGCQITRSGTRPTVRRAKRLSSLVYTVVCLRAWLLGRAYLQNALVDNVPRVPGCSVSGQRFPLWPRSLPLHGTIFHSRRSCLARIWAWTFAVGNVRMEVDWRGNNCWRDCAHLHSGTNSRPVSAKLDQTRANEWAEANR
jgi:hypothetical protein